MSKKPSSWVLDSEPALTTDQVYLVMGFAGEPGDRSLQKGVVIADTADQATLVVLEHYGWSTLVAINESELDAQIDLAMNSPVHVVRNRLGWPGHERFALLFETDTTFRLVWVLAANEMAARSAWPELGEIQAPKLVMPLTALVAQRDHVRQVRMDRGNGAIADGRQFSDRDERWFELEAQKRPGGRAELNANARRLHAIRERVHAKQGDTP
jgi:hypothetical protein